MKSCICAIFLFAAACGSSPAKSSAQLNERDPACAECPAGCCQDGAKAAESKTEAKADCCAGENAAKKN